MSQTTNIDNMIIMLQQRLPISLGTTQCGAELNKAWRAIESKGAFTWNIRSATFTVAPLGNTASAVPADLDIGKPVSIYPTSLTGLFYEIRYLPFEEFVRHQLYRFTFPTPGAYSCWTYISTGATPTYTISFAPASANPTIASGSQNYSMYYHHQVGPPLVVGSGNFFPTPDAFDDCIVDGAEAELRRIYSLAGFEMVQKKFENSTMLLLDKYRSPKHDLAGISETMMETQEKAAT